MVTVVNFYFADDPLNITYKATLNTTIECPHCANKNSFEFLNKGVGLVNSKQVNYITKCQNCNSFFIAQYSIEGTICGYECDQSFKSIHPNNEYKHHFPKEIEQISSKFIEIYQQAMIAHINNLNQLVGMGLRKAFEFLITDYIITVLNTAPANTLEKRIEQINVTNVDVNATLVRWIGNDNTHTQTSHPEFTIDDMIDSIDIVVYYLYAEYKSLKRRKQINLKD